MKNPEKNPVAQQIAANLRREFKSLKFYNAPLDDRCPCCKQLIPIVYTQEWLATQCGMTKAKIVHYFQGNRVPSIPDLLKIAGVLDCALDDLLKDITTKPTEEMK